MVIGEVARQPKPEAGEEYLPLPLLTRRERGLPDNQRGKRDSARGRGRSDTKRGRGQKSTGWRADRDLFLEVPVPLPSPLPSPLLLC